MRRKACEILAGRALRMRARPVVVRQRRRRRSAGPLAAIFVVLGVWARPASIGSGAVRAAGLGLYDAGLGSLPSEQGWVFAALPPGASASQTLGDGVAQLDSLAEIAEQAGWFRTLEPSPGLDRQAGFTLSVDLRLDQERHAGSDKNADGLDDRAGLSLILLSSDLQGIELGFWLDRVWAQEGGPNEPPRFTQAESAARAGGDRLQRYRIRIKGDRYALFESEPDAPLPARPLLEGPLRDYSAEGFPYTSAGFVFIGDDTASAAARFGLARVALETAGAEPSPSPLPSPTVGASPSPLPPSAVPPDPGPATAPPAYLPHLSRHRIAPGADFGMGGRLRALLRRLAEGHRSPR